MLAKKYRLSSAEIKKVFSSGQRQYFPRISFFIFFPSEKKQVIPQIAIIVRRRDISSAVLRNRLKRRIAEVIRKYFITRLMPVKIIIIPKQPLSYWSSNRIADYLEKAFRKLKLIKN